MPNTSHNRTPRFDDEIDAGIVNCFVEQVSDKGYVNIDSEYGHHLVAWAPFKTDGHIHTTTYDQNQKEQLQSYVQQDGGINIGTEEWSGKRIVVLVLDQLIED